MGKGTNDPCKGGVALFLLKNEHSHTAKIELIEDLINQCAAKKSKGEGKVSKKSGKKRMSGYNCYMKECAKKTGNFSQCLTDKGWAGLPDNKKKDYNKMALEGCDI